MKSGSGREWWDCVFRHREGEGGRADAHTLFTRIWLSDLICWGQLEVFHVFYISHIQSSWAARLVGCDVMCGVA